LVRGQDVTGLLLVGGRGEHDPVHAPIRGQQGTTGVSGTHHGAYLVDFPAHLTLVVEVGPLSHLLGPDTRWNGREATVTGEPGHDRVIALGGLVLNSRGSSSRPGTWSTARSCTESNRTSVASIWCPSRVTTRRSSVTPATTCAFVMMCSVE